jgi:hypothetical protein
MRVTGASRCRAPHMGAQPCFWARAGLPLPPNARLGKANPGGRPARDRPGLRPRCPPTPSPKIPFARRKVAGGRFAPCHPLPLRWAPFASGEPPRSPAPFRLRRSRRPKGGRPGAVGPDARKASPQRRGVLDVRRRRRRARPDKADGPTPPTLPRRGVGCPI